MCSRPFASARSVPGTGGQVQRRRPRRWRCAAGRRRCAWRPSARACVEVLHGRRHGVRRVGADEQDRGGLGDIGQRERQPAVDAERAVAGGGGRGHAEPAVVVDHRRAQRDPGELAERVGLLVGQTAAAEAADRVAAVALLGAGDRRDHALERLVPGGRAQRRWCGRRRSSRTSGVSSRSGWSSRSAAVQPLAHSPPRLVGKFSCGCSVARTVARASLGGARRPS